LFLNMVANLTRLRVEFIGSLGISSGRFLVMKLSFQPIIKVKTDNIRKT